MSQQQKEIPINQPQDIVGGGISREVFKQIQARETLISQQNKSKEHLLFFNSNGAWARMVSSVNTISEVDSRDLAVGSLTVEQVKGSKNLAYNNVLMGGTLKQGTSNNPTSLGGGVSEMTHSPIQIDEQGFVQPGDIKNNAYHKYESLGFRPTPGLTSVAVKSKGTYGTLREAEVEFKVWSLEDLEVMQALYLRPGYSILLEWGHSLQLDSSSLPGNLSVREQITTYKRFLEDDIRDPMATFEKDLLQLTQQADYNYDAFVGYVSNFNWSLNQDGGYDCMVKIIAKGSIIESIAATFDTSTVYPAEQLKPLKEGKGKDERKSIYHKLFSEMKRNILYGAGARIYKRDNLNQKKNTYNSGEHFTKTLNNFMYLRLSNIEKEGTGFFDDDDLNEFWLPLHAVLDVFNNYIALVDNTKDPGKGTNSPGRKLVQFYTGWQDTNTEGAYEKKNKYLTSDQHFSINPLVCVLPKKPKLIKLLNSKGDVVRWPNGEDSYKLGVIWKDKFHEFIEQGFTTKLLRGDENDILNIFISANYIQTELDTIIKTAEDSDQNGNNNIVDFIKTLLKSMNDAMGGINDLDLVYDEPTDLFYILDRKVTPTQIDTIPSLSLSGTKSVISDVNITSQISSNIASMVSIAAQGTEGNSRDNVAPLLKWNRGLLDRHIRHKAQSTSDDQAKVTQTEDRSNPEDTQLEKWIEDYYEYWQELNGASFWDNGDFKEELVGALSNYHKIFCQKYVVEAYYKDPSDPKPPPGVIPVELSFSTMGIGGLKIGQAFRIEPGLLPQNYNQNFGYIITGLSHTIQDSKWTTDIKTQFYNLQKPSNVEIENYKKKNPITSKYALGTDSGGTPSNISNIETAPENAIDPAPVINPNKIGTLSPINSPVYRRTGIDLRNSSKSDVLKLFNEGRLIQIGNANFEPNYFALYTSTAKLLDGKYYLEASAGRAAMGWISELKRKGINFIISSAIRYGANTGKGPHGYGIALDFGNLSYLVDNSTDISTNRNARIQYPIYRQIAEIGANYGWYNPWRLSNNAGTMDELWHFEYWGQP